MQLLLILAALLVATGGVVMLFRGARSQDGSPRAAYVPLGTIAVGLLIAYRSLTGFPAMDTVDLVIMSLFVVALLTLLGLQFFIVDRHKT